MPRDPAAGTYRARAPAPRVKGLPPGAENRGVTGERLSEAAIDGACETLLTRFPDAAVAAISPDGVRVAVPPGRLDGLASVPLPPGRATVLDLVVRDDRPALVAAWERTLRVGTARAAVRLRATPDRRTTVTFLDLRHRDGVLLAVLTEDDSPRPTGPEQGPEQGPAEPTRPRAATVTKDMFAVITDVDDRALRMLGFPREQIVGQRSSEFIHPEDQERAIANWLELLSRKSGQRVRLRHRRHDESWLWVEIENLYEDAAAPEDVVVRAELSDISDEMAAHETVSTETAPLRPRTGTMTKDMFATVTDVDDRALRMLGFAREEIVGRRSSEFVHPEDQERAIANWLELLSRKSGQRVRLRHRRHDDGWLWVEIENLYEDAAAPEDVVIRTQLSDISDEMAAHEAVRQREELFRRLAEALPIGLLQVEVDRSVVYANERLQTILGVTGTGGLDEQLSTVTRETRQALDVAFDEVLDRGLDQELEVAVELPETGERRRCAVMMTALTSREGRPGALVTVNDVTESSRLREELRIKATYDTLTGCHNRASAMTLLEARLDADRRTGETTAVVFIDLDHFKPVNDRLGHAAGDELLTVAARRLREVLRDGDAVGRIGGDEFLLVCHGVVGEEQARKLAARVSDALHAEVELAAGSVRLSGSIGVAVSAADLTADQVVALADTAMYESKRLGDGTPVLYDGERYTPLT